MIYIYIYFLPFVIIIIIFKIFIFLSFFGDIPLDLIPSLGGNLHNTRRRLNVCNFFPVLATISFHRSKEGKERAVCALCANKTENKQTENPRGNCQRPKTMVDAACSWILILPEFSLCLKTRKATLQRQYQITFPSWVIVVGHPWEIHPKRIYFHGYTKRSLLLI